MIETKHAGTKKRAGAFLLRPPALRRCAAWALQAALMAALTGSRLPGELSPFSTALCAAALARGWSPLPLAAGCALFGLIAGWPAQALFALAGCAVSLGAERLARRLAGARLARLRDGLTGLVACAAVLLPGLIVSHALPYNLITTALSASIAALLAPTLTGALALSPKRRALLPDEQLSCAILAVMLIAGLGSLPFWGVEIAEGAAVLLTLVAASRGPGAGAAGGIACGAALALGTGVAPAGSALALGGLLAGCARPLPRPAAALGVCLGNALALTDGIGFTLGGVGLWPLLVAGALYCALPRRWLRRIGRLMDTAAPRCAPDRLARQLRREAGETLLRLGRAFEATARAWDGGDPEPDEAALVARMREALCAGCADYARCWQGDHPEAGRLMCRLLSEAVCNGEATPLGERPPAIVRHCRRSAQMDRRLQPMLRGLCEARRQRREREGLRRLAARQAGSAAHALGEAGRAALRPVAMKPELARLAAAALDRANLPVAQVTACAENGALRISAAPARGAWSQQEAARAADALVGELGAPFRWRRLPGEISFHAAPPLAARAGVCLSAPQSDAPCGDAARVCALPDGRLMAVLSDGMGRGARAAAESGKTVSLLRTFLEAGFDSGDALEAANALLQTGPGGELFATVDLCVIDLMTGEARLSKLGACASLLVSDGEVTAIAGGRLPIGILASVEPAEQRLTLRPGATLILYSDGVADDLQEEETAWLRQAALSVAALPPEAAARALCSAAAARARRQDDRSAVVIRIEEAKRASA